MSNHTPSPEHSHTTPANTVQYAKLLIPDEPLQVLPSLAVAIGLNEAIVLQQLHYWLNPKRNIGEEHDGRRWVYNTYDQWQENFPFWSIDTIKRTILRLEKAGLIEGTDAYNRDARDRTKWYTINYGHADLHGGEGNLPCSKSDAICPAGEGNLPCSNKEQRLPSENTAESGFSGEGESAGESPVQAKAEKKQSPKKISTTIPDDFVPNERTRQWALDKGVSHKDIDNETEAFIAYHGAKGNKFVDHQKAFQTWITNGIKWDRIKVRTVATRASAEAPPERRSAFANQNDYWTGQHGKES